MRYEAPLSLPVMDLDHVMQLNHAGGNGDGRLRHVARLATDQLRHSDILARYGGDKLCALLPHTPRHGALILAERLRTFVESATFSHGTYSASITLSIGVAEIDGDPATSAALFERADRAMHQAKAGGHNHVCG